MSLEPTKNRHQIVSTHIVKKCLQVNRTWIPLPPQKQASPYLEVSLWFGDILLSEKQCPICLRLHEKAFRNQTFPRGRVPRPLYSKIFVLSNCKPPPPHWKARSAPAEGLIKGTCDYLAVREQYCMGKSVQIVRSCKKHDGRSKWELSGLEN